MRSCVQVRWPRAAPPISSVGRGCASRPVGCVTAPTTAATAATSSWESAVSTGPRPRLVSRCDSHSEAPREREPRRRPHNKHRTKKNTIKLDSTFSRRGTDHTPLQTDGKVSHEGNSRLVRSSQGEAWVRDILAIARRSRGYKSTCPTP